MVPLIGGGCIANDVFWLRSAVTNCQRLPVVKNRFQVGGLTPNFNG